MKKSFAILVAFMLPCVVFILNAQDFTFALLTDIHVSKSTTAFDDLKNSVESINSNPDIKFVIVSGDITEEGDRASLERAKSELDQLKVKYYITSGNHETKWSESGVTDFGHIFKSDRFKFEYNGYLFIGFNSGPIIRMMDGHVGQQDIIWLKKELDKAAKGQPVIVVTHYPLLDGDVDNWYQVTDLIRQYNVRIILGGHYHKNQQVFYDGIPAIINRSNLRGKEDLGGYSIYKLDSDSILVYEKDINKPPYKWAGYSLTEKYYTEDISSYKRPDYSVNTEYSDVKEIWLTNNEGAIYSSPVVYKENVFVGDDLGYMTCFSLKDGKRKWSFKTGNRILGTPAVENDIVVFGSTDKNIYGVDAISGHILWKYETDAAVIGGVAIENGMAYVGGSDHRFFGLNITNGKPEWIYSGIAGYIETRPLIYDNKVFFGAWDNNMYALDKNTGELKWKWNGDLARMHFSPAAVWPVGANGKIFFTAPNRVMTAVDATTGKTIWQTNQSMVRETIGLSEDKTLIYSKTMQDSVVCYSAIADTAKRIWATNVSYGYDHAPSMPLEKDGVVFGSTKNGIIFAIDAISGKLLWKHKVGNSLINTVVALNAKECIFASAEGSIGMLRFENKQSKSNRK